MGKLFPFAVVGVVEVALVVVAARLIFQVPIRGSILLLLAARCCSCSPPSESASLFRLSPKPSSRR